MDQRYALSRPSVETVLIAIVAAGVTAFQLSRPGALFGITPDVSAWLGASVRLVHGAVPCRDFVLTQPPGFTVLATPFAALSELIGTRDTLAVMRLFAPLIAAANVLLAARLVRHRGGAAILVAGAVLGLSPAMLYALQGPMLEPLLALFCLLGLALLFDGDSVAGPRRVCYAGAALGFATAIKLPALIPVVLIALLLVLTARRRLLPLIGGAVAGFGLPALPFILLAPGEFVRDVIGTQLNRVPGGGRVPLGPRLADVTGTAWIGGGDIAAIAVVAAAAAVVVGAYLFVRQRVALLDWFAGAAAAAVLLAQLGPALYYPHYAAFTAPFAAVLLGLAAGRIATVAPRRSVAAAAVGLCVALITLNAVALRGLTAPDYAAVIDAVVPAGGCTLSDSPAKLFTSDRFVAVRGDCTTVTDPNGAAIALGGDPPLAARMWQTAFEHSDFVVTDRPIASWYISPASSLLQYVAHEFRAEWRNGLLFYIRR